MSQRWTVGWAALLVAALNVACLEFAPAQGPTVQQPPTSSPTATFIATATSVPPTQAPTSTVTPTLTATSTPTTVSLTPQAGGTVIAPGGTPQPPFTPPLIPTPTSILLIGTPTPSPAKCAGDEQMSFTPSAPSVRDEVIISVTAVKLQEGVRVTGPSPAEFLGSSQGGLGFVSRWRVVPQEPGLQTYNFWLGETTKCASVSFNLLQPTPTATATKTPTATGTPRPDH